RPVRLSRIRRGRPFKRRKGGVAVDPLSDDTLDSIRRRDRRQGGPGQGDAEAGARGPSAPLRFSRSAPGREAVRGSVLGGAEGQLRNDSRFRLPRQRGSAHGGFARLAGGERGIEGGGHHRPGGDGGGGRPAGLCGGAENLAAGRTGCRHLPPRRPGADPRNRGGAEVVTPSTRRPLPILRSFVMIRCRKAVWVLLFHSIRY